MRRLLAAVFCLALPTAALAAGEDDASGTDPRFDKGSWEVSIRLNPNSGLSPAIGYFLADNFSVIVHLGLSAVAFENPGAPDDEVNEGEIAAEALFNIPTHSNVVPFVGAGGAVFSQEVKSAGTTIADGDGTEVYAVGGLRFLVGVIASLNLYLELGGTTVDDNLAAASQDGTFGRAGVSYSLFF